MRCIKPPAETNLNDCRGDLLLAKCFEDGANKDLKLRGWADALFDLVGGIKGACYRLGKREWGEWLPVDLHPLAIADQVWLRGGCVADPRCAESRRDKGDNAPLAVRSSHERTANPRFRGAEGSQKGV
jgi:hypothetical protein